MTHAKLDAALHALLAEGSARDAIAPSPGGSAGLAPATAALAPARQARVFLDCRPNATLAYAGVTDTARSASTSIRTATVPLDALTQMAAQRDVRRIILARRLRPLLDLALPRVLVPAFRASTGLSAASVVIGIIDTGLDGRHPAFASRVLRVWDQTQRGAGVPEGAYGVELTGAGITGSRDADGHGTHVAGIAAGDHPVFGGVAPGASLVIVRTTMDDTDIADGIRYVFRAAAERGAPAVVNISIGGHDDPHDGTDPLSRFIDEVSGPGRIVCCAAGNEGDDNIHGEIRVVRGRDAGMRFRVPARSVTEAGLTGWYAPGSRLAISVRTPDGKVTAFQDVIGTGSPARRYQLSGTQITLTTPGPDRTNGDHNFRVTLHSRTKGHAVRQGVWQLRLRLISGPPVTVHAWALDDGDAPEVQFTGTSRRDTMKIGSPGAATRAVSVASFTTRGEWTSLDGSRVELGYPPGRVTSFSSEGPLRTGARKPDLTAPGAGIVSARSRHSKPEPEDLVEARFVVSSGTSMASPFVAGLVALLLDRDPTLTPEQVKRRLRAASRIPGRRAGTFDIKWGYGLVDATRL